MDDSLGPPFTGFGSNPLHTKITTLVSVSLRSIFLMVMAPVANLKCVLVVLVLTAGNAHVESRRQLTITFVVIGHDRLSYQKQPGC